MGNNDWYIPYYSRLCIQEDVHWRTAERVDSTVLSLQSDVSLKVGYVLELCWELRNDNSILIQGQLTMQN